MSEGIMRVRVKAPADRVRRAFTEPADMRAWLAEHAFTDENTYEFWGRYTPDGERGRQKLLHADERSVRFTWLAHDIEATVELSVDVVDGETLVRLSHDPFPDWREAIVEETKAGAMHTFWCLALANLVEHVEGRSALGFCDFTSAEQRLTFDIAAAPMDVFEALVDAEKFQRWFGAKCSIEPHLGGRWAMGSFENETDTARIIALDPGEKFALRFSDGMVSSWELEGSGGKTRLTFVQSGFDAARPPFGSYLGWVSGFVELRRMLEIDDWRPMWHSFEVPGMPEGILTYE